MKLTQEQVIAWAREAGAFVEFVGEDDFGFDRTQLERFAALAYEAGRKDENEACAVMTNILQKSGVSEEHLADAIRARREQ